ncbi:hypothetical protein [Tepidibacter mesophilus]|uniref:hypothetical protein n=1 Tax=Tepidibacter mesophilus TaxID=655607 RepID=UPI000C06B91F|nr:hypothetical protein [Tepidibacter mesophilus]
MQTATASGLRSRMTRLPGEETCYDPDTGVYFKPSTGRIEDLSEKYKRLPGEALYYKIGANKKCFDPAIYKQFIVKSRDYDLTAKIKNESKSGFTVYIGLDIDLGAGIGGGTSGSFALSYNKSKKTWTLSMVNSVSGSSVAGTDMDAGVTIGFVNGNEKALSGWTKSGSANTPIGDISVAGDGDNVTVQLKVGPGIGGGTSSGVSFSKSINLFTVRSFF